MSKTIPTEFASALEIGGPTPDGLIHLTFTRAGIGERQTGVERRSLSSDGYEAEEIPAVASVVPVATIMIPYPIFKKFGPMFTEIGAQIEERRRREQQLKAASKAAKAEGTSPSED
ncbi:hypothetical protein ACJ6WI_21940 [Stenotrophomonas maltophilia]|uniref:hypothetical protein n=1 Tax=Stenotrophomonas TaxID=40323 RepID=UPI00058726F3|nr:hypothetical protein [Stenotrophomonas sp. SKA14]